MVTGLEIVLKNDEKLGGIEIACVRGGLIIAVDKEKRPNCKYEIVDKNKFRIIVPESVYLKIPYEEMKFVGYPELNKEENFLPSLIKRDKELWKE
jgi:hypothetical protein